MTRYCGNKICPDEHGGQTAWKYNVFANTVRWRLVICQMLSTGVVEMAVYIKPIKFHTSSTTARISTHGIMSHVGHGKN